VNASRSESCPPILPRVSGIETLSLESTPRLLRNDGFEVAMPDGYSFGTD
jgi:hypothetical protein